MLASGLYFILSPARVWVPNRRLKFLNLNCTSGLGLGPKGVVWRSMTVMSPAGSRFEAGNVQNLEQGRACSH